MGKGLDPVCVVSVFDEWFVWSAFSIAALALSLQQDQVIVDSLWTGYMLLNI